MLSNKLKCILEMIVGKDDDEDCDQCEKEKDDDYKEKASRMKVYSSANKKMWMP